MEVEETNRGARKGGRDGRKEGGIDLEGLKGKWVSMSLLISVLPTFLTENNLSGRKKQ